MHKLCYLVVLLFVVNIALGDVDENGFTHNYSESTEKFFTPATATNIAINEHVSEPTIEQKILQRLDSLEDSVKALIKEIQRNATIPYPQNCRGATKLKQYSGIYDIQATKYGPQPFKVYCEEDLFDGGWTVVFRRIDGSVKFTDRNWTEYKEGFGDLNGEFFIGLDKLYALTNGVYEQELIFVMEDFVNNRKHAKYSAFAIEDESEEYRIKTLGGYSGNAGDSFSYHRNQTFKTKDRTRSCTIFGAWWYNDGCYESNLFGSYLLDASDDTYGMVWYGFHDRFYSLKFAQMMIRPKPYTFI